jgi:hypothetical protein
MTDASSIFEILLKLALPVGVLSYLMIRWTLKTGMVGEADGIRALSKEIDALAKQHKKDKKNKSGNATAKGKKLNPVHSKCCIVALYTYGLIEWNEIRETIAGFGGIRPFISSLNIDLLINMIIEGLMNFIAAISWPVYWIGEFGSRRMWVWMAVAYGAYWLGMKAAQHFSTPGKDERI